MATKLYINYVRAADMPSGINEVRRLKMKEDKNLFIDSHDGTNAVQHAYDFRGTPQDDHRSYVSPNGYNDLVYRYMVDGDGVHLWVCCIVPANTDMPSPDYQEITAAANTTVFIASGQTDSALGTATVPNWIPQTFTDAAKKARAVEAIKAWRMRKKAWLLESPEYADLIPEITKHLGYWLRAADYAIWYEFDQKKRDDAGESITGAKDWLIIEAMAKEMSKGPLTLDPDGDGAYNAEFFQRFRAFIYGATAPSVPAHPTGPSQGVLYLNTTATWTSPDDVERVEFTYTLMQHASQRTRYAGLSAAYNPTTEYW